jgi:hypothetical protein
MVTLVEVTLLVLMVGAPSDVEDAFPCGVPETLTVTKAQPGNAPAIAAVAAALAMTVQRRVVGFISSAPWESE